MAVTHTDRWLRQAAGLALVVATWGAAGCGRPQVPVASQGDAPEPALAAPRHAVTIWTPDGPPTIPTGTFDEKGRPVSVACATCHATKPANPDARVGAPLKEFHSGLVGKHGNLTCVSCHNPADGYATLRLADGRSVPYREVMTLCAQCHGPQYRDYLNGAHGGMTGFWDLGQGGRARNNCINCHDPHAPKYPTVAPAPGPNDRFLNGGGHD